MAYVDHMIIDDVQSLGKMASQWQCTTSNGRAASLWGITLYGVACALFQIYSSLRWIFASGNNLETINLYNIKWVNVYDAYFIIMSDKLRK